MYRHLSEKIIGYQLVVREPLETIGTRLPKFLLFLQQMFSDEIRKKLENIVGGIVIKEQNDTCTTIRNFLCASFSTSTSVKKDFESKAIVKEKQVEFLTELAARHSYWIKDLPGEEQYLTKGGEARIYLHKDNKSVIKINDAIYYATWLEFFNSLVIHNLFFPETAYIFLGFTEKDNSLKAVIQQPFISSDAIADLADIKQLLSYNGFENTRRQDYLNSELGLILEDMHDENVILKSNTLFFIDTVFYTFTNEK